MFYVIMTFVFLAGLRCTCQESAGIGWRKKQKQ